MVEDEYNKNVHYLNEVIQNEQKERSTIKENLKNFRSAVDARTQEIENQLEEQKQQRLEELERQAALLNKLINEN